MSVVKKILSGATCVVLMGAAAATQAPVASAARAQDDRKDYLSDQEADQIREAQDPAARIKLYLGFAQDRLQKFEYEVARPTKEAQYDDILNSLMNAYVGCIDDAADQIDAAHEKQADIRDAVKVMKDKDTAFLAELNKLDEGSGADFEAYRYTLEDAIEGTKQAINDATDAQKTLLPAPVRRKQQ
jgi:hypothetical protein